ncbi:Casein kinase II subunit beta [Rhizoctonia solani]|uniref:Casein kinase II subunit beta n=1 Tax=Rhizoctonia solani TaxID=456999 RepID=A0A8H7IBY9_9AGAM|nr:Casein kinase II subunit beta [Rhizoctonia solani]
MVPVIQGERILLRGRRGLHSRSIQPHRLNSEVSNYQLALDFVTDNLDDDIDEERRQSGRGISPTLIWPYPCKMDRHLARTLENGNFLRTGEKLLSSHPQSSKSTKGRFWSLSSCHVPIPTTPACGLTDVPYEKAVKLYCPRCEDLYSPKSSRHGSIDGAYFGTTFPHMLLMGYPHMIPSKENRDGRRREGEDDKGVPSGVGVVEQSTAAAALKAERYRPKIFGFGFMKLVNG